MIVNKKKEPSRCYLTKEQKLEILEKKENNPKLSVRTLAEEYKVKKSSIKKLVSSSGSIKEVLLQTLPGSKKLAHKEKHRALNEAIFHLVVSMRHPTFRCMPLPISRSIIQSRALFEARRLNIPDFKASDGWFKNLRKRNGIGSSIRLFGEAGDVSIDQFQEEMEKLKEELLEPDD